MAGPPAPPLEIGPPTRVEVKQLWWFTDGAIMDVGTREHLWLARGLCPRHTWMFFCAETELKYQPLGVAVLFEDLVGRMADALHRPVGTRRRKSRVLHAHASCLTCDYASAAKSDPVAFSTERDRVAASDRTRDWVAGSQQVWQLAACARCLPACSSAKPVTCRTHLAEASSAREIDFVVRYLTILRRRLAVCVESMTFDGPSRRADSDAALVEALGWFAGWHAAAPYLPRS